MTKTKAPAERPAIHVLAEESDLVAGLALTTEQRQPVVAAMLLEEIERAELHELETLPDTAITIGSEVDFVDERTHQMRTVELVLPARANIAEGRISILTPIGAALYGLTAGQSIDWPDLDGHERRIRIVRVRQPLDGEPAAAA